jgi:ribosomal protein L11 methyltransferase
LAEARRWPALEVRAAEADASGLHEGLVSVALEGVAVLDIEDLNPIHIHSGGHWEPSEPPPEAPPPKPLAWRICFASFDDRERATRAIETLDLGLELTIVDLPDEDWVARSQRTLCAVHAGAFIVAPPWDVPDPLPADARLIVIEPSMGFGTGHHATTRLCLRALGTPDLTGRAVLDLGTGSGVLALAAASLGASSITAVDIDADAIAAARQSAALNPSGGAVRFAVADVFAAPPEPADLVFANLTGAMLTRAAARILPLVGPAGTLIVSGFMADERDDVEAAFADLAVRARFEEEGWCAAVLTRAPQA